MIRVLVVDDSAIVRKVLSEELSRCPDIEVVGTAVDPYVARDKIIKLRPDVITLDVEMPRMDGLSFLAKLMKHYPMPVVLVSSVTPKNSAAAIQALALGAVEVICKPNSSYSLPDVSRELTRAIRTAAASKVTQREAPAEPAPNMATTVQINHLQTTHKIIVIGASTGGVGAIETVLKGFPSSSPGIVIVQHMPEHFTKSFAERLNGIVPMEVREARDRDVVAPGLVLLAPGGIHLMLQRNGALYVVQLKDGPPIHHQKPAVDIMFQTAARSAGSNAIGVLLTGMGADGAKGLLALRESGAHTIAQDEHSCVVFGMPKEAIKLDAAVQVIPLTEIARTVTNRLTHQQAAA